MSDRDHATRELAAALEADPKASRAERLSEAKAALREALMSLMSASRGDERSADGIQKRRMTARQIGPMLPG